MAGEVAQAGGLVSKFLRYAVIIGGVAAVLTLTSGIGGAETLNAVMSSGQSLGAMDVPKMALEGSADVIGLLGEGCAWVGNHLAGAIGTTAPVPALV